MENQVKPKISVVMPIYNASSFLSQAIESILSQTFTDFELILVDDASTDDSVEIINKYLTDSRIIFWQNKKNHGMAYSLNQGLKLAKAEIVARMDSDDVSEPTRLEKQFAFLLKNPGITVVGCDVKIIDENNHVFDHRTKPSDPEKIKANLIVYSPLVHPAVMYRKSPVIELGGYREQFSYISDIDLWYRLAYSGYKISNLKEFLLLYRYHQTSTAHQSKFNAKVEFQIRRQTIKDFKLKLSLKQWFLIYSQFLVGYLLSGRVRQKFEGWYKIIFYHGK